MRSRVGKLAKWVKKETKEIIVRELEKESLTFEELFKRCKISRATLAKHLNELEANLEARKVYSRKKKRVVYELTAQAFLVYATERRIRYLGEIALYQALKEKLGVTTPVNLKEEINKVIEAFEKEGIMPKELIKYMESNYPLSLYREKKL